MSWNSSFQHPHDFVFPSASLWGCELKCNSFLLFSSPKSVSLLVRLWVEMMVNSFNSLNSLSQPPCEAVSWNNSVCTCVFTAIGQPPCEAVSWNYKGCKSEGLTKGQPPCEAVSWNVACGNKYSDALRSASLWGCELKYRKNESEVMKRMSASLWGCELKCSIYFVLTYYHSSASLWGCELKCSPKCKNAIRELVSLLVRLWVEIYHHETDR